MSPILKYPALVGLSLAPLLATAADIKAFPPQVTLSDGTVIALTTNLAWDINRIDGGPAEDQDDQDWRRKEVGLLARKDGVYDLAVFYDVHNEMWLDAALRVQTSALFGRDLGQLRAGNMKLHAGLEGVAANRHATFMENSAATQVFYAGARAGVTWTLARPDFLLDVGVFGRDFDDNNAGGTQLLRAAWTPTTAAGGQGHLGLALTRDTPAGTTNALGQYAAAGKRWNSRGGASLAPDRLVDTGMISGVTAIERQNLQAMWLQGPLWAQGEYFTQQTSRTAGLRGHDSHGGHVAAGWVFNATPRRLAQGMVLNPKPVAGRLGTELLARYGRVDLDADGIAGGTLTEWTLGSNLYVGAWLKLQANYTEGRARRAGLPQDARTVQLRTQFYF